MKYIELLRRLLDLWSQKSEVVAKWVSGDSTARFCDKQVFSIQSSEKSAWLMSLPSDADNITFLHIFPLL